MVKGMASESAGRRPTEETKPSFTTKSYGTPKGGAKKLPNGPDLTCLVCMLLLAQLDVRITYHSVYGAFLTAVGGMLWGLCRIRNTSQSCEHIYKATWL
jgi:hypothetical protein